MKLLSFIAVLLFPGLSSAQKSNWIPFRVDNHFTVRFPSKPDEMDVPGTMALQENSKATNPRMLASRAFRHEDDCGVYVLVCVPLFEAPQLPSTPVAREAYYKARTIPLFISHARAQLLSQDISIIGGLDVITLTYRALGVTGSPTIKFFRQVVVERTIYQLNFVPADKIGNNCATQRDRFFNSIRIKRIAK
jgi:hypothetical protein